MRITGIRGAHVLAILMVLVAPMVFSGAKQESNSYYDVGSPPPLWLVTVSRDDINEILPYNEANKAARDIITKAFSKMTTDGLDANYLGFFWISEDMRCTLYPVTNDFELLKHKDVPEEEFDSDDCVKITDKIKMAIDRSNDGSYRTLHIYESLRNEVELLKTRLSAVIAQQHHPSEIEIDPSLLDIDLFSLEDAHAGLAGPDKVYLYSLKYNHELYAVRLAYTDGGFFVVEKVFGPGYETIPGAIWPQQQVTMELIPPDSFSVSYVAADGNRYVRVLKYVGNSKFMLVESS